MEKIKIKAKEDGMESWIWARVLDIYEEEMERGKTHEFDCIIFDNKNTNRKYQLIDTPGHQKFVRSMIEGISQNVNIGIVLISMKDNEFEASFGPGMMKEHLILARAIGIEHLVLIANKMDIIDWDEKKCKEKIIAVTKYLVKTLMWPKENLHVVPISAFSGIGLMNSEGLPKWYKGKSFIETLDDIPSNTSEKDIELKHVDSNRIVVELTNVGSANSYSIVENTHSVQNDSNNNEKENSVSTIISAGYFCMAHFNGIESEVHVEKISNGGKPFLRSGEKAKCILLLQSKYSVAVGMRIILRKNNNTVAFGTVTKSF